MTVTLREKLEENFDALGEEETQDEREVTPADEAPEPEPVEAAQEGNEEPDQAEEKPETDAAAARDEKGRFAKARAEAAAAEKAAATATAAAPAKAGTPAAQPVTPTVADRAPQSWTPAAREKWAALPPEAKREINRREKEIATTLQEGAEHRRISEGFRQAVGPYEAMIRAQGADPMRTVGGLLQTQYALHSGPPAQKAKVVASIIKGFGVDIDQLAAELDGGTQPTQPGQRQPQAVDPQAITQQVMQGLQQQAAQRLAQKQAAAAEAFVAKHEFGNELRADAADIMEMAARRGVSMTLEEAFAKAAGLHPEISGIMAQRKAAEQANAAKASTQRARVASSSIKSRPAAVSSSAHPKSLRDQLAAKLDEADGQ